MIEIKLSSINSEANILDVITWCEETFEERSKDTWFFDYIRNKFVLTEEQLSLFIMRWKDE
jgi:hypothetical protein